jgi:predicted dithiol-disulfide oxidoreductase (DUF899 family)
MTQSAGKSRKVASREEWLEARKDLLVKEKQLTRQSDALAIERRHLPWVKVDEQYVFDTPKGKKTLSDLFDGRSQLIVYQFMFGPEWKEGCHGCSMISDHIGGSTQHLANRDVTLLAVSRAPLSKIDEFKKRMDWRFRWVSSFGSDFNRDYHVSFSEEDLAKGDVEYNFTKQTSWRRDEAPGASVFYKNEKGEVFHTYSTYGRGNEQFMGVYRYLDLVPKGRDEDGLPNPSAWVKHHDRYEQDYYADAKAEQQTKVAGGR